MSVFRFSSPLHQDATSVTNRLRDGSVATMRPLGPGEIDPLQAVFDGLSQASRTGRYLVGIHSLNSVMRDALAAVDGHRHVAWLASIDGRPAGIARFVRVAPRTAEVAFEVVDEHQGLGLGAVLLDTVTTVAAVSGVDRVQASVLPSNHRSLRLLAQIGLRLRPSDGLLEGEAPLRLLDPPRVDRPAVVRLALGPIPPPEPLHDQKSSWTAAAVSAH
jgi:GNAT superfamily N-acetyltransferase